MKDALKSSKEIRARMRAAKRVALFLDFDGTLAPIVRDSTKALMPESTRVVVERLAERIHVFIVTGRSLKDIRSRAPVKDVEYAGNHGIEWTQEGKVRRGKVSARALEDLRDAIKASRSISEIPGAFVENKKYSISFHYRNIASAQVSEFMRATKAILWPIVARGRTEILEQKKVLEIRVRGAHKGEFARSALTRLPKGTLAIYIGDDTTDEDAFAALPEGVTVRVGPRERSAAQYFLRAQSDVATFLSSLLA